MLELALGAELALACGTESMTTLVAPTLILAHSSSFGVKSEHLLALLVHVPYGVHNGYLPDRPLNLQDPRRRLLPVL